MIRILHVLPWGFVLGGLETTLMSYYRAIDRTKIQFDFYVPTEVDNHEIQYYENEAISLGARVFRHPPHIKHPFKSTLTLYRLLRKHKEYKIVHIYGRISLFPALSALAAMLAGVRVRVVNSPCSKTEHVVIHKLFRPMLRALTTHKTACSIVAGEFMYGKKAIKKCTLSMRERNLEPYRYNKEHRSKVRNELSIDNYYAVIHVARMDHNKNHGLILDAFHGALASERNLVLLLVGYGELLPTLQDKTNKLGISDKVRFLGKRDDVPDLLQAADMFVLPSISEGLPGVAIEAQAAGLPCLLSNAITAEVKILESTELLPINKGSDIWAERMLAYREFNRRDTLEEIRRVGYDISDAVKSLEELYYNALSTAYKSKRG
jgi:glycosyltransferase involved in cell wall biosynthesis